MRAKKQEAIQKTVTMIDQAKSVGETPCPELVDAVNLLSNNMQHEILSPDINVDLSTDSQDNEVGKQKSDMATQEIQAGESSDQVPLMVAKNLHDSEVNIKDIPLTQEAGVAEEEVLPVVKEQRRRCSRLQKDILKTMPDGNKTMGGGKRTLECTNLNFKNSFFLF